ncbi:MAG: LytTR family DNA-binding domain-containing protein [Bacteroidales bacterium]|nr:LytTR family DNA-binding domain-containing protein [Bacteroidales bacterium]
MKVVIIEDELPAIEKLENLLNKYDPEIEVIARLNSVVATIEWISKNVHKADLFFMDIQLIDGSGFEVFREVEINKPVIFITAYDHYAIQAFKVNSIDYLLKPLEYKDLYRSLEKIKSLRENLPANKEQAQFEELSRALLNIKKEYKSRFMVKVGDHLKSVRSEDILLFYAEGRTVFIITKKHNKYIIDYTLEELNNLMDPDIFFRANRTFIVNINAIRDVVIYSNSRLLVVLNFEFDKEIIVSRDKVAQLKTWFEGLK